MPALEHDQISIDLARIKKYPNCKIKYKQIQLSQTIKDPFWYCQPETPLIGTGCASQPTTPTRVTNNMQFRLSTDSTKSASRAQTLNKPKTSTLPPLSPAINIDRKVSRSYYNVSEQQISNKPPMMRTPVRSSNNKPPSGVSQTPQRHRSGPGAGGSCTSTAPGSRLR